MTVVKICGLTRLDDAQTAADAGADILCFNFYPGSKRYIAPEVAAGLIAALRAENGLLPAVCGLFVNASPDDIRAVADRCNLDMVQLAGDEPPEDLTYIGLPALKTLRPLLGEDAAALDARAEPYRDAARHLPAGLFVQPLVVLLDAAVPGQYGGTGTVGDWELAAQFSGRSPQSALMLAGGLTPDNVADAVRRVQPWGVDVANGVETMPGVKDPVRVRAFVRAVREAIHG